MPTTTAADLRPVLGRPEAPLLIDVRTGGEFESGHIPGAYNVPLDTLGEHRAELARLDRPVVLVCQSGNRAGQAEAQLAAAGMTNISVLRGGMNAWDGDVRVTRQRWSLERQVRLVAGLIVAVSVLVSLAVPGTQWVAFAVGAGLTFAAVTDTCAMGMLLARLPYNRATSSCDPDEMVRQLTTA